MKKLKGFKFGKGFVYFMLIFSSAAICFAQTEKSASAKFSLFAADKSGNFVTDLTKEDITVFIDGKEQSNFVLETETAPLIYMISVDNSGSMRLLFEDIILSAKTIIGKNKAEDSASLMRFVSADKIQPAAKFTSDRNYLLRVLDNYYIEGGQTALTDAIYRSVELVAEQPAASENTRRIVVVISDGEDRESKRTRAQLTELLKKTNVQIFFVGLVNELPDKSGTQELIIVDQDGKTKKVQQKYTSLRKAAVELIENLVRESGGAAIYPAKNQKISPVAEQVAAQMQTQFVVKVEDTKGGKIEIKPTKRAEKRNLKFYYRADLSK